MKAATIKINLNDEQITRITVAELVESYRCLGSSTHPEDINNDKKIKKAIGRVLRYYTTSTEYAKLGIGYTAVS